MFARRRYSSESKTPVRNNSIRLETRNLQAIESILGSYAGFNHEIDLIRELPSLSGEISWEILSLFIKILGTLYHTWDLWPVSYISDVHLVMQPFCVLLLIYIAHFHGIKMFLAHPMAPRAPDSDHIILPPMQGVEKMWQQEDVVWRVQEDRRLRAGGRREVGPLTSNGRSYSNRTFRVDYSPIDMMDNIKTPTMSALIVLLLPPQPKTNICPYCLPRGSNALHLCLNDTWNGLGLKFWRYAICPSEIFHTHFQSSVVSVYWPIQFKETHKLLQKIMITCSLGIEVSDEDDQYITVATEGHGWDVKHIPEFMSFTGFKRKA
ncbi:hypothetical protein EV421DRAFT_1740524 [Armillaria borealis]|uniref:Uncharacterized protein n=1 Tax=Armillaria borealis TaxID=47425 RepID=A0AA39MHT9_9AGAR|nr:hypothetical protein EV421DRAFT_1740524 [Armillaria borealis]